MAGTDCGFSTFAGFGAVDEDIVYAKLGIDGRRSSYRQRQAVALI